MTTTEPELSLAKKIFFSVVLILLLGIILEIFLYAFLKLKVDNYSFSSQIEARDNIVNDNAVDIINRPSEVALHPYLGYVLNPDKNTKKRTSSHWGLSISEYGFLDDDDPFVQQNDDSIVIGIFGGSVAFHLSVFGVEALVQQLKNSPVFAGKDIEIVRVALGGYKQPQLLMALTYLLSQGATFDIIINLDGFNEVALPPIHNIPNKVSPFYPRSWHWQANAIMSNQTKSLVGRLAFLKDTRKSIASTINDSALRFSNMVNLVWLAADGFMARSMGRMQIEMISSVVEHKASYERNGPEYIYEDDVTMYGELASHWSLSSQQMNEESEYKRPAEAGYTTFIEAGHELAKTNNQYHDLTMIFKDHPESVYSDDCCHLNQHGNDILGTTIGKLMVKDIEALASPPQQSK